MEKTNDQKVQRQPAEPIRFEPATSTRMTCEKAVELVQKREHLNYMLMMFLASHMKNDDITHGPNCPAHDAELTEEIDKRSVEMLVEHGRRRDWDGL
jgi:hypothetical protein